MKWLKYVGVGILVAAILAIGFKVGDWWTSRISDREIATLKTELAKNSETLEIQEGLYATEAIKTFKLQSLLDVSRDEVAKLARHLEDTNAKLLTAEQISIRWKKAYEAALKANQVEEPPTEPGGQPRKRVDFVGDLGPIRATGHTLTDPPEAFLKLEQTIPLLLTVAVAQNSDKTWSTFVTSSDENIDVKINLAGVNPLILSPKWYQRLWVEIGASFLGDPVGTVHVGYYGDRFSVGATCYTAGSSANGCGATLGYRIFK